MALFDQQRFVAWLNSQQFFEQRFDGLCSCVCDYAVQRLENRSHGKEVAESLWDVISRCNDLTFASDAQSDAYGFLHFIDRYHRAWTSFLHLLSHRLWPRLHRRFDFLDIGAGPGPALYAMSDMHWKIQEFLHGPSWKNVSEGSLLRPDYVERSDAFRHWLHFFTEFANGRTVGEGWNVPFHNGTFRDYSSVEYDQRGFVRDFDDDGDEILVPHTRRHRFSLIVAGNFLTTPKSVQTFANQISQSVRYLKNTGAFLCLGAESSKGQYARIYESLRETIHATRCSNWRYQARCREVHSMTKILTRSSAGPSEFRLREYFRDLIGVFKRAHVWKFVPDKAKQYLTNGTSDSSVTWEVRIFRKQSRLRVRHSSRKRLPGTAVTGT